MGAQHCDSEVYASKEKAEKFGVSSLNFRKKALHHIKIIFQPIRTDIKSSPSAHLVFLQ